MPEEMKFAMRRLGLGDPVDADIDRAVDAFTRVAGTMGVV